MIDVSPELLAFLKDEYDRCRDDKLEDERTTAIDRYNGEPYGDEQDGRSQVVARDTAETTDYMVISILRTIVGGERVVEFVHRNTEAAHQATETIMHLLMDEQDGYTILHDWLKAGLLEKNAVAMTYGEPQQPKRRMLEGVSALGLMAAEQQGLEIKEAEETGEEGAEGPLFNAAAHEKRPPKFCDAAVPNEEFYCSLDARTITEAQLKGRKRARPIHELVAEGFEEEELTGLGSDAYCDNVLAQARDNNRNTDAGARRGTARSVWWHEDYVTFDANGDGVAETLYIRRTGDFKVFSIDELEDADDHPFEDWCPFPMQHRRIGQSLFDKVGDLERVSTVVLRQSLDGMYLANQPATWLHEESIGENTIQDLLTVRPGAIRRWKGSVKPEVTQDRFDPGAGFEVLEYLERKRESRTGITRLNQGLDEKTLNDTAQGQAQLIQKGEQMEEYVARNFANKLAKLMTKKAKLLRKYGQPIMVPIDGEYVEVDPRQWPEDMLARVKVGLGATRKDQRLAFRRELMGYQANAMDGGLRIVDEKKLYNSAKGFIADAQLGDVTEFFNDPDKLPPEEPKPDPETAKAQGEMQLKQADQQARQQVSAAKHQLAQQEISAKLSLAQQEGALKLQLVREEAAAKLQLEREKASAEIQLNRERMAAEIELEREKIRMQAESAIHRNEVQRDVGLNRNREGGDLSK